MKTLMNPILYEALRRLRRWRYIGPVIRRLDRVPMAELPPDASWESSMGMAKGTEREILGYRSAMVDLASGVVIHHDKGVIGTQKMVNHQRQNFESTRLQLPASIVAMEGCVASMDWCWSTNYYHFLRDTLPMLYSLRSFPHVEELQLVTWRTFNREEMELIQAVLPGKQPVQLNYWDRVKADWIIVPPLYSAVDEANEVYLGIEEVPQAIRNIYRQKWREVQLAVAPRRIYLGRKDTKRRRLLNENQVMELLATRGFVSILTAQLPISHQFQLFRKAEAIVGVRGASIGNLLAIDHPLKFISIRPTRGEGNAYLGPMVEKGNLIYGEVCGDGGSKDADFSIDLHALEQELNRLEIQP